MVDRLGVGIGQADALPVGELLAERGPCLGELADPSGRLVLAAALGRPGEFGPLRVADPLRFG